MKTFDTAFQQKSNSEITYIRKFYSSILTSEQKKYLDKLQSISKEIIKQNKDSPFGDTLQDVNPIFKSIIKQLKRFKRLIENQWKFDKSDYQAFKLKAQKLNTPMIDILSIVNIKKRIQPAQISDLREINFPILSYENKQLTRLSSLILRNTKFAQDQNIGIQKITGLITRISKSYNVVSYHNFSHAFGLFLMLYQSYQMSQQFKSFISSFQIFVALLAALSHDLNHKGVNNLYHMKKKSQLAQKYNNQSTLQNMHISTLFRIFKDFPQFDLINLIKDPLLKQRAKRLLIRCVLATDMAKHFGSIQTFRQKRKATDEMKIKKTQLNQYMSFQKNRMQDRQILLDFVIHSCDIGNPCLQYNNYMNWAALLAHQFNQQTKKQSFNGLEVTGFLKYGDKNGFYKGQLAFSKNFVLPLWKQISLLWPSLSDFSKQTQTNLQILQRVIQGQNQNSNKQ